ncbi:MAG: radical SAM protein [Candidatus Gracilibacteria bacterium]|nr:radical SAM protein [Candidatus Gracilibacteria bacterium]MDD2908604.1 radical SAM protein [Candidatus Gracilibacteria bacterium]
MINKIFYSLVLFPDITYNKSILGYNICGISENKFGEIKVIFRNKTKKTIIIFVHNDFKKTDFLYKTKNWQLFGDDIGLVRHVYDLVIINEINDFNFFKEKEFYNNIPFGTVLTITSKCNLFCNYCFNEYDYPLKNRNFRNSLSLYEYKKIVDKLYCAGTRDIIITGGEPLTSSFLFELLEYIKQKGIFIRINTNGTLLFENILKKLNDGFSLNLMVSLHEFNNKDYFEINQKGAISIHGLEEAKSFENKFENKFKMLKSINNYENLTLDFLTILTNKNIINLEKIYEFVLKNFNLENWHFFRLYSTANCNGISRPMINLAIHKIFKLNKEYDVDFKIVDSVPFCVTKDIDIASKIIDGELSVNHNVKTIIGTEGNIQIMSAFDSNVGNIFENNILDIWQGDFIQKMLNNGFLPEECSDCKYKEDCRGGSRMVANMINGSYNSFDSLGDINNKITF